MENLPLYISAVFIAITALALYFFYRAARKSKTVLVLLFLWLAVQAVAGLSGFYTVTDTVPPRLLGMIGLPVVLIIGLFATAKGRRFIDGLDMNYLTLLHTVRVPVEIVLLWLFLHGTIPQLMTFEGRNFDILSGLTAPLTWYFGIQRNRLGNGLMLLWNFICLGLLLNIITHGILSAPSNFQVFAFNQPNIAVLYFPFVWLPACIVPLVMFCHLASIRQLLLSRKKLSAHSETTAVSVKEFMA
ncbi:MAG TPA: hypothetical protein VGB56_12470 [Flavisolibacter sp.]|jgi:hypothetical protein